MVAPDSGVLVVVVTEPLIFADCAVAARENPTRRNTLKILRIVI